MEIEFQIVSTMSWWNRNRVLTLRVMLMLHMASKNRAISMLSRTKRKEGVIEENVWRPIISGARGNVKKAELYVRKSPYVSLQVTRRECTDMT